MPLGESKKRGSIRSCAGVGDWFVYILECADGTLYTGITTDVERRFKTHASGKGSRYTRAKGAVRVVYEEVYVHKSAALSREARIKKLSRAKKLALVRETPGEAGK